MNNLRNVKGFKDYLPNDAKRRRIVVGKLSEVFEKYGFDPLETPTLEYASTLEGKYGAEEKLIYKFETPGDDKVALKYDQTVPLARVISQYGPRGDQLLTIPFKRFQIQSAFRGENTQKGRYREFLQCDVDIIGVDSPLADAEILTLVADAYKALGLDVTILINDRSSLKEFSNKTLNAVDKLKKIGRDGVLEILKNDGMSNDEATEIFEKIVNQPISNRLQTVIDIMDKLGRDNIKFEPTLMRGLDYYTGIIIEVVSKSEPESSSLGGGGRWDEMIGKFCGLDMPAIGFSFGVDRVIEAMTNDGLFENESQANGILVAIPNPELEGKAIEVWKKLNESGVNAEMWLDPKASLDKQFKYADNKNKQYVVLVEENGIKVKNLTDGSAVNTNIDDLAGVF